MAQRIYYVEDEVDLRTLYQKYLTFQGYEVTCFGDGQAAMDRIEDQVDLWILDINLPADKIYNGFDLIKKIKTNNPQTLVIFTSARDQDIDKVHGLELGADDYIAKPFSPKELILRVQLILKRSIPQIEDDLIVSGYKINSKTRDVYTTHGEEIKLTSKEYDLLLYFLKKRNISIKREQILEELWGENYGGNPRVVDDLLRRLRKKMPLLKIVTKYGNGYMLS